MTLFHSSNVLSIHVLEEGEYKDTPFVLFPGCGIHTTTLLRVCAVLRFGSWGRVHGQNDQEMVDNATTRFISETFVTLHVFLLLGHIVGAVSQIDRFRAWLCGVARDHSDFVFDQMAFAWDGFVLKYEELQTLTMRREQQQAAVGLSSQPRKQLTRAIFLSIQFRMELHSALECACAAALPFTPQGYEQHQQLIGLAIAKAKQDMREGFVILREKIATEMTK